MPELVNRLRHKIVLQGREVTKDAYGGVVEKWVDGPSIFAGVEYLRGNEFFAQANIPQVEARVDARIRIRFRRGLTPADIRVKHGPTIYDVLAVIQDGRNYETQLMVKARDLDQGQGGTVNP